MEHGKEKRRDPRVPLVLRVDYPGLPQAVRDATENLSAGGLFIRTDRSLTVGQRVPLVVSFPGLLDPVEVEAEVVRLRFDPAARRSYRVLVVEDNPHVVEMYEYALKKLRKDEGAVRVAVEYAAEGHQALCRLAEPPKPDLVMLDLYMPVMDGFTLVERMRQDPSLADLPVLVISAGGPDARVRAIELGVDVFLEKPVQFADIMSTVRTLLRIKG